MDKTTKRLIALLLFAVVAVVAVSGNIVWLNYWTALSAALTATAIGLIYKSIDEKKRDEYQPQRTLQGRPLRDEEGYNPKPTHPSQPLQNNTDNIYNINNSPNAVIMIDSEKTKDEESSEDGHK
jgi:hypothetical protein